MTSIFKQAKATFKQKYGTMIFGWEDGSGYIENPPDLYSISLSKPLSNYSILKTVSYSVNKVHSRLFTRTVCNLAEEMMRYSKGEWIYSLHYNSKFGEDH